MEKIWVASSAIAVLAMASTFAYADSTKDAVLAADAAMVKAYNAKDAATMAAYYDEDAAALPTNDLRVDGRAAIQKMWQGGIDYGYTDLGLNTTEVQDAGGWAYAVGTYSVKFTDKNGKPGTEIGKYVEIWKKGADSKWYLHRDIWNADPPKQ